MGVKMSEIKCEKCDKEFTNKESLDMHNKAKHTEEIKQPLISDKQKKKIRNYAIAILIIVLIVWGITSLAKRDESNYIPLNVNPVDPSRVPTGAIHWHPHLTIEINGKQIEIPANIGLNVGRAVDTGLGMDKGMAPTHTHSSDGAIHFENLNPQAKPETFVLGYFFYVWNKPFNSTCIFEYCTDKGNLKMTVNDIENNEFENYLMKDKDEILIRYTSK